MADNQRIDDLRRRVQKDPASIAFAQLAEECRRAGQYEESVEVCRAGLAIHPGYLSARVTLGRALIELDQLDEAQTALELVLKSAAENLSAIRGLAEIHHRRGSLPEALAQYRAALGLARNDPDLQRTVADLARVVEPPKPPESDEGLSFEQLQSEFMQHSPPPVVRPPVPGSAEGEPDSADAPVADLDQALADPFAFLQGNEPSPEPFDSAQSGELSAEHLAALEGGEPPAETFDFLRDIETPALQETPPLQSGEDTAARQLAMQTIAALEQWLDAIHVTRAQRIA